MKIFIKMSCWPLYDLQNVISKSNHIRDNDLLTTLHDLRECIKFAVNGNFDALECPEILVVGSCPAETFVQLIENYNKANLIESFKLWDLCRVMWQLWHWLNFQDYHSTCQKSEFITVPDLQYHLFRSEISGVFSPFESFCFLILFLSKNYLGSFSELFFITVYCIQYTYSCFGEK